MTTCIHCQGQNRDQARFCGHCGKPLSTETSSQVRTVKQMLCEQCGAEVIAGAEYCEGCGAPVAAAPNRLSQAPAVQKSASLSEALCYYCTQLIPTGALICPSCGKERKELHDLRLAALNPAVGLIIWWLALGAIFMGTAKERWATLFGQLDTIEMVNDPIFWLLLSLFVTTGLITGFFIRRFRRRYTELSGGKKWW